jgi:myo-inositol-1(or 4)-monophosphatase
MNVMVAAVLKAGRALARDFGEVENLQVSMKGPADFVSVADRRSEEILHRELAKARPGFSFIMEESGTVEGTDTAHTWIVDPLDGTSNFLHGIPHFSISVALRRTETLVAGVIFNPVTNELYTAERGGGAYLNDRRIRVASRRRLSDSVVVCGIPHMGRGDQSLFLREMHLLLPRVAGVRRTGSAALDLAWVAAGRCDAFWERGLSPWDVAAGLVLVREAGGTISTADGRDNVMETGSVVVANEEIHRELLPLLKEAATS